MTKQYNLPMTLDELLMLHMGMSMAALRLRTMSVCDDEIVNDIDWQALVIKQSQEAELLALRIENKLIKLGYNTEGDKL